jgi:uncharacterized protein YndB with AHSA1/START domain
MARTAHLVRIHATPEEVFRRVASTAGIAEWFTQAWYGAPLDSAR